MAEVARIARPLIRALGPRDALEKKLIANLARVYVHTAWLTACSFTTDPRRCIQMNEAADKGISTFLRLMKALDAYRAQRPDSSGVLT
jgi:hypothetical protein